MRVAQRLGGEVRRPPGRTARRRRRRLGRRGRCAGRSRRSAVPRQLIGTTMIDLTRRAVERALRRAAAIGSLAASGMNTVSPALERAPELRIAVEVDDVVADAGILVARDQSHVARPARPGRSSSGRARRSRRARAIDWTMSTKWSEPLISWRMSITARRCLRSCSSALDPGFAAVRPRRMRVPRSWSRPDWGTTHNKTPAPQRKPWIG